VSHVVGIDLGGTKVAVAALGDDRLLESRVQPTELSNSGALIEQLVDLASSVGEGDAAAIGIGVPSVVEFTTGRVVSSVNIPLSDVPLREVLGDRLGIPVFVDNDATVAALAEAHDDALQLVARNLVMLTIGTGVGGGIVLGGRIYRGASGGAGELGHTLVALQHSEGSAVPAPERFPQYGSLEHVASGHALDRLSTQVAAAHPDSALARAADGHGKVLGPECVKAAHAGDSAALHALAVWATWVGVGVANAINTFDPEEVVIGGGGAQAGELLLKQARATASGYVLPGLGTRTTIRLARHGVRAGVLGAALLAKHELEDQEAER
jgi:glucokinase